jgi:hypothetical protein
VTTQGHPASTKVSEDTVRLAIRFMRKVFLHALAIYGDCISASVDAPIEIARAAARSILADAVTEFNRSDLRRKSKPFAKLRSRRQQEEILELLQDYGWIAPIGNSDVHGARWEVNPKVHTLFASEGEAHRRLRATIKERIVEARGANSPNAP